MKKLVVIGFSLGMLFIATLIFMHYQKHPSDSKIRRNLPGTWILNMAGDLRTTYIMSADGHWTGQVSGKTTAGRMDGTWQVKDGFLISTTTNSNFGTNTSLRVQTPASVSSRIIRIDSHEFVVQTRNTQVAFKKVEP
jgi:hypothetical protein